jgi:putative PEP-CTERM system TPR-repeat lipoprotein
MYSKKRFWAGLLFLALFAFLIAGCSKDPKKYIASGKQYLAQGKYSEAIIELKNAIKADPNLPEAYYQLALAQLSAGQLGDAYQTLLRTLQLSPYNLDAQLRLANLLMLESRFDDARQKAEMILKRNPNNWRALILLGNTYAQMIHNDGSIDEIQKGLLIEPRIMPAYLDLAEHKNTKRDVAPAEEAYKKAASMAQDSMEPTIALANFYQILDRKDEAEKLLLFALSRDRNSADVNNALAFFYLQNKRLAEAEATYARARDSHPHESLPKVVFADFLKQVGQMDGAIAAYKELAVENETKVLARKRLVGIYLSQKDLNKADALVGEILNLDPKDADAQMFQGQILLIKNKPLEGIKALEASVKAKPASSHAHYFLGLAYNNSGNMQKAESEIGMAKSLDATFTPAYTTLAQMKLNSGDSQMAAVLARQALALNANIGDAHLILGSALLNLKDYPGAKTEIEEFLRQNPSHPAGHHMLGSLFASQGNSAQAEQEFENALKASPQSIEILSSLIGLYIAQNSQQKALDRMNQVIAQNPKQTKLYEILSRVFLSMNNQQKAEESLVKAASIDPNNAAQRQVLGDFYQAIGNIGKSIEVLEALAKEKPGDAGIKQQLANIYFNQKAYDKTGKIADELLKANPKSAEGLVLKGRLLLAQNKVKEAIPHLSSAVNQNANSPIARYFYGLALVQSGDRQGADREWTEASRNPGHFLAPVLALAQLKLESRSADESMRYAQQARAIAPDRSEPYLILGMAQLQKGDVNAAVANLENYVGRNPNNSIGQQQLGVACLTMGNFPRALMQFEAALKLNPNDIGALSGIANVYFRQKKPDQAIRRVSQQLENVKGVAQASMLRLLAELYISQNNPARAEEFYQRAVQADPKNMELRYSLASFYQMTGNFKKSVEVLQAIAQGSPQNVFVKKQIASSYLKQQLWDKGLQVVEEVLKANSKDAEAHILKSQLLRGQGKNDSAIAAAQAAVNADPRSAAAQYVLGQSYLSKDPHSPQAERALKEAIKINPKFVVAAIKLAWIYAESGSNLDEALRLAQTAKDNAPNSVGVLDTLGWVYYRRSAYQSALEVFKDCVEKNPQSPIYQYHLGMSYEKIGNKANAKASLSEALRLSTNFPGADEARSILARL